MSKIAIFASGTGSNAREIIRYFKKSSSAVKVECIITNKKEAGVYAIAQQENIPIYFYSNTEFKNGEKIITFLKSQQVEWLVLAGFLRKIESVFLQQFPNRIINIHPSLLPKYGGKGMYGNFVHKAVIQNQETESGITIHLVNDEFDDGEIIFQASCDIKKGQTVEDLLDNIQKLEHQFFPAEVEKYILENQS